MIILRNPKACFATPKLRTPHLQQKSISTKIKDMKNPELMKLLNVLFFVPFDKYSYINTSYVQFFSSASCWPWSPQSPKLPALPKDWDPKTSCLSPHPGLMDIVRFDLLGYPTQSLWCLDHETNDPWNQWSDGPTRWSSLNIKMEHNSKGFWSNYTISPT